MCIAFLQAVYDKRFPLPQNPDEYHRLLEDIELFAIGPQVYQLLWSEGRLNEVPEFFQEKIKSQFTLTLCNNLVMKHLEEQLMQAFEQSKIPAIPLKGVQFAERYFGHLGARGTGDFDFYVPLDRLDEGIECVKSLGYQFEIIKDHHARLYKEDMNVELHWTFDKQYWSDLDPTPFWLTSEPFKQYQSIRQLTTQNTFYFICLHSARHQMDSVRFLLDIVQMLSRDGEDIEYEALFKQAERDGTLRRLRTVLTIVYENFPHLKQLKPFPLPPVNSYWNYATIRKASLGLRDLRYYFYKLHFKHLIFDSWKYFFISIRKPY